MAEYIKTPTIFISSPSFGSSLTYLTREKAIAKITELFARDKDIDLHIEYRPNGQIIKGFNEDTQKVE